jgi:hypothetical protein
VSTDKPGKTRDDFGGSDDSRAEDYRGPAGHVSPEVGSLFDFQLKHKNIHGVINTHRYGGDILIPTGNKADPADYQFLEGIADKMSAASAHKLKVINGATGLYPTTGDSDDFERANGMVPFTYELGRSFQPVPSTIAPVTDQVTRSQLSFIDQIIDLNAAGKLPAAGVNLLPTLIRGSGPPSFCREPCGIPELLLSRGICLERASGSRRGAGQNDPSGEGTAPAVGRARSRRCFTWHRG